MVQGEGEKIPGETTAAPYVPHPWHKSLA